MAKKKRFDNGGKLDGTGTTDPTVVPPKGDSSPITKKQIIDKERERLAKEKRDRPVLRPKKRPDSDKVLRPRNRYAPPPTGPGGDEALPTRKSTPKDEGDSASQRRFDRVPTRPKQEEPGGTLEGMGPEIVGRRRKPMQLAPIERKHGGMVKKGGKSKVRGAGIARKGVRPAKMR